MRRRDRKNRLELAIEQIGHDGIGAACRSERLKTCCAICVLLLAAGCADPVRPTQTAAGAVTPAPTVPEPSLAIAPPIEPILPEPPLLVSPPISPVQVASTWYAAIYCGDVPLEDSSLTNYADRVIASDGDGPIVGGGYKMCGAVPVAVRVRGNAATVQVYEIQIRLTFIGYRDGHISDGRVLTWAEPDTYTETIEAK